MEEVHSGPCCLNYSIIERVRGMADKTRIMQSWTKTLIGPAVRAAAFLFCASVVAAYYDLSSKTTIWWTTFNDLKVAFAVLGGFTLVGTGALLGRRSLRKMSAAASVTIVVVCSLATMFLLHVLLSLPISYGSIATQSAVIAVAVVSSLRLSPALASTIAVLVTAAFSSKILASRDSLFIRPAESLRFNKETSLYSLSIVGANENFPQQSTGGGFAFVDNHLLVATADGVIRLMEKHGEAFQTIASVEGKLNMNRAAFSVESRGTHGQWFRVLDIENRREGDINRILVSHHHYDVDRRCTVVRVATARLRSGHTLEDLRAAVFRTVYETIPCLPAVASEPGWPFRGMEGGGRIAFVGSDRFLLTVGDHGFNGVDFEKERDLVNDPSADYGKVLELGIEAPFRAVFTTGHRNQQGLLIKSDGSVWSTEHGPQGGDELNRLERGAHYGWPNVSYGTEYSTKAWPKNPLQGRHDGFTMPVFSWIPSVGLSNLIEVKGSLFQNWNGDLLVSSLVGRRLFRIRLDSNRVVFSEPIDIGHPVRDILQDSLGQIIVLGSDYRVETLRPKNSVMASCTGCHSIDNEKSGRMGPHLVGIVGRRVGSVSGFEYSEAMKNAGGNWTEERLLQFLENPQQHVPGTAMAFNGVASSETREAIVEYLKALR